MVEPTSEQPAPARNFMQDVIPEDHKLTVAPLEVVRHFGPTFITVNPGHSVILYEGGINWNSPDDIYELKDRNGHVSRIMAMPIDNLVQREGFINDTNAQEVLLEAISQELLQVSPEFVLTYIERKKTETTPNPDTDNMIRIGLNSAANARVRAQAVKNLFSAGQTTKIPFSQNAFYQQLNNLVSTTDQILAKIPTR